MNDGSLFKEPLPLGVLLLIEDEPRCLDEDVDNFDTSFFQNFILQQSDSKIVNNCCNIVRYIYLIVDQVAKSMMKIAGKTTRNGPFGIVRCYVPI